MYSILTGFNKSEKFDSYSEALQFQMEHGGKIYQKVYSSDGGRRY